MNDQDINQDDSKHVGDRHATERSTADLDILKHIEVLTERVNQNMSGRGKVVFQRYPLTFTLLVLFGAVAVGEGVKGILEIIGFQGHPLYLFALGICILIFTGTLYKKLGK